MIKKEAPRKILMEHMGIDVLKNGDELSPIKAGLMDNFKGWLFQYEAAAMDSLHLFKSNDAKQKIKNQLEFGHQLLLQTENLAGNSVKIGNTEFNTMLFDNGIGYPLYILFPKGKFSPANITWIVESSINQRSELQNMLPMRVPQSDMPLFEIFLPPDFSISETKNIPLTGWVQDFGPITIHNNIARDELPIRTGGHSPHEAMHKYIEICYPEMYWKLFRPYPHLDEGLAKASEIIRGYDVVSTVEMYRRTIKTNPASMKAMPAGMSQSETSIHTVENVLHPFNFAALDGKQIFDHSTYASRLLFGMFIVTMLRGAAIGGTHIDLQGILFDGLKSLEDKEEITHLLQLYYLSEKLEQFSQAGQFNEDTFWNVILGLEKSESNLTKKVEKLYRKFLPVVYLWYSIFNLPKEDTGSDRRVTFADIDDRIINSAYWKAKSLGLLRKKTS